MNQLTSLEICAGAGGQALGLEQAGFQHLALIEIDHNACLTLEFNRPVWNVIRGDIKNFDGSKFLNTIDLLAGGVPCPPFSIAGKQLGENDERDLFPEVLRLVSEINPKAILIENVKGLLDRKFSQYREQIIRELDILGYKSDWKLINSSDFGVPQLRPRAILVAMKPQYFTKFNWPQKKDEILTVGEALYPLMSELGWEKASEWVKTAYKPAPTLVGGSKKHGGADLGPTRAKSAWRDLGIDGSGIANEAPRNGFAGNPKLTLKMTARIQGFPDNWTFVGKKTPAYRQIGNAFPPPVAREIGIAIIQALKDEK